MWPARGFSNGSHVSQIEMIPELRLLQGHVQEKLEPTVINQACNHQSVRNILGRKVIAGHNNHRADDETG